MKKQWSSYFQRLLFEQRTEEKEQKQIETLNDQFENLKLAVLASIEDTEQSKIVSGIVKHKRLSDFLFGLDCIPSFLCSTDYNLEKIIENQGIKEYCDFYDLIQLNDYHAVPYRTILLKNDGSFFDCKFSIGFIENLKTEWDEFKKLPIKIKKIILESLHGLYRPGMIVRHHSESVDEFIKVTKNRNYRRIIQEGENTNCSAV